MEVTIGEIFMKNSFLLTLVLISHSNINSMGIQNWLLSWKCWCGCRCRRANTRKLWLGLPNGGAQAKQLIAQATDTDDIRLELPILSLRFKEKED